MWFIACNAALWRSLVCMDNRKRHLWWGSERPLRGHLKEPAIVHLGTISPTTPPRKKIGHASQEGCAQHERPPFITLISPHWLCLSFKGKQLSITIHRKAAVWSWLPLLAAQSQATGTTLKPEKADDMKAF
eukprot:scaffold19828_cov19-Tisochrysis_lutea.AAC.2